jgi:RNA polymerase subunit RPABC4/transcription elongation factor Spt4
MNTLDRHAAQVQLTEGLMVWREQCPCCHSQQLTQDARKPFLHIEHCAMSSEIGKHPGVRTT